MTLEVIILAAGKGTRMRSQLPKVLHPIAGKPMVSHVVDTAKALNAVKTHMVIGHGADLVKAYFKDESIEWAIQAEQLGTGHAVAQSLPYLSDSSTALIVYGDVPLVNQNTLQQLVDQAVEQQSLSLLTVHLDNPTGYGRIVRDKQQVMAIVEQKDASAEQLNIQEVNTGIMALPAKYLQQWLPQLSADNAQGEYYLTDVVAMAVNDGVAINTHHPKTAMEVEGANNRIQLAALERFYQLQQAEQLMLAGATLIDPHRVDIRGTVSVGEDVVIDINAIFIGNVTIGNNVSIGANCIIENTQVGDGTVIKANSVIEEAIIAEQCDIGPFARIRPGSQLANNAKIGNFVETKKAIIGEGSKVNHLSYIGDSDIGAGVNIGAGTITCNYDGVNKSKTIIEDGAFIGSNSSLVAPVTIGKNATVGAGSTISKNVAAEQLSVARGKQRNVDNWSRPIKLLK
ncbi:bifunctional UDP-N-acetylglucosamine diphosphorylase/glucosamine-1-phosphate N-acetyltransferase GlmU [bacterium]|nr:bifunctional UDP-N-acetylglucosamine diphosphorylase/glucosamine-1-phosphate N-acetyltransferase GlmU [bacterium]